MHSETVNQNICIFPFVVTGGKTSLSRSSTSDTFYHNNNTSNPCNISVSKFHHVFNILLKDSIKYYDILGGKVLNSSLKIRL